MSCFVIVFVSFIWFHNAIVSFLFLVRLLFAQAMNCQIFRFSSMAKRKKSFIKFIKRNDISVCNFLVFYFSISSKFKRIIILRSSPSVRGWSWCWWWRCSMFNLILKMGFSPRFLLDFVFIGFFLHLHLCRFAFISFLLPFFRFLFISESISIQFFFFCSVLVFQLPLSEPLITILLPFRCSYFFSSSSSLFSIFLPSFCCCSMKETDFYLFIECDTYTHAHHTMFACL